jgi:hypothetical protein
MSDLLDRWRHATVEYMNAILELQIHLSSLPKDRYELLKNGVESARKAADDARKAVDRHREEHGCK